MNWSVRALRTAVIVASISSLAVAGGAPALAGPIEEPTDTVALSEPMRVAYIDHGVAAANGFEIRVDESGNEYSEPVTVEARTAVGTAEGEVGWLGTVKGPCGTSTLLLSRNGPEVVRIGTAFRVYAATVWHVWNVSLNNSFGGWNENFDGGPTGGSWDAVHEKNIRSSHGVTAQVSPGSYATLVNGAVCFSGSPTAGS